MNINEYLDYASKQYFEGNPIISDTEYDILSARYDDKVGYHISGGLEHFKQMYSLKKVFDEEPPTDSEHIISPKLDGAAISLLYKHGTLVRGLTRGNGIKGEDITEKVLLMQSIPNQLRTDAFEFLQITGEVVSPKFISDNPRNYASGALHLKDIEEFRNRVVSFVAYSIEYHIMDTYDEDMCYLKHLGFRTVVTDYLEDYPTDGIVVRINDNSAFNSLGYTAKHPRGAWAIKQSSDVETKETILREVTWQVGSSGKVTPVAHFDEVNLDGANVNKATLHNAGFIENMELDVGDTILVVRSGAVIPKVLGKV